MTTVHSKTVLDSILNWEIGTTFPAAPASLYIALLTAMPTDNTGTGMTEVTGNGYARVNVTSGQWGAISTVSSFTEQSSNNATLSFPTPTGSGWGAVVGYAVCVNTSTINGAGNEANWTRAVTFTGGTQTISAGETVQFLAGNLARQAA
jgi:hypothetical protein